MLTPKTKSSRLVLPRGVALTSGDEPTDADAGTLSFDATTDKARIKLSTGWTDFGGGAPSGAAGGDLAGTYPNPNVAAIHETSGPTQLTIGAVADGQYLLRSGTNLIGGTPAGIVNPYLKAPASPHSLDDEFDSGSADLATRGWSVVVYGTTTTMTRAGDIQLNPGAGIAANQYRSTIVGSSLFIQSASLMNVFKTIPNTGTQRSQFTVRARFPSNQTLRRNYRAIMASNQDPGAGQAWFSNGAGKVAVWNYQYPPSDGLYQAWFLATENLGGANAYASGPTTLPTGSRPDVLWMQRRGAGGSGGGSMAMIDSASGSIEAWLDSTGALSYAMNTDVITVGFAIGSSYNTWSDNLWVDTSVIDYFRFTDAPTASPTIANVWFG